MEKNIGLSIAHIENPLDPEASYPALANMTAEQKLSQWKLLLEGSKKTTDDVSKLEMNEWFMRANEARCIRNLYIHGEWEYLPMRKDKPVSVQTSPWMRGKSGAGAVEQMNLIDLESTANELKKLFEEFVRIRKKYGI